MSDLQRQRLQEARARACHLMDALGCAVLGHSLQSAGWSFGFDRAKRRLGCCTWKKGDRLVKRITLSRYHVALNGLDFEDASGLRVLDDVIRHEIAHAIDYEQRGRSRHDARWKSICKRCGADATRLYEGGELASLPGKYVAACPSCGSETHFYRRPRKRRACGPCCKEFNNGRYSARFELVVRERTTGRKIAL